MSPPSRKPITWKQKYNFDYGPPDTQTHRYRSPSGHTHTQTHIGPPLDRLEMNLIHNDFLKLKLRRYYTVSRSGTSCSNDYITKKERVFNRMRGGRASASEKLDRRSKYARLENVNN